MQRSFVFCILVSYLGKVPADERAGSIFSGEAPVGAVRAVVLGALRHVENLSEDAVRALPAHARRVKERQAVSGVWQSSRVHVATVRRLLT